MAQDSEWKPAFDFTVSIDSVEPLMDSIEYKQTVGTFDANHQLSAGAYEFGVDVTRHDLRGSFLIDEDDVRDVTFKNLVTASYNDGIATFSGKLRITEKTRTGAGKGAYKINFTATFTGPVTVS